MLHTWLRCGHIAKEINALSPSHFYHLQVHNSIATASLATLANSHIVMTVTMTGTDDTNGERQIQI